MAIWNPVFLVFAFLHYNQGKWGIVTLALVAIALAQQHPHSPVQPVAAILKQAQDISPEGSYSYAYETENGIAASEQGSPQPVGPKGDPAVIAQGQFQYTAPDGTPIALQYTADENGFHPQGAHLPIAPQVPEQIQKAIAYVLAHPQPENQQ
ncbi:CUD1 protein, partial [Pseudoatta argentina]